MRKPSDVSCDERDTCKHYAAHGAFICHDCLDSIEPLPAFKAASGWTFPDVGVAPTSTWYRPLQDVPGTKGAITFPFHVGQADMARLSRLSEGPVLQYLMDVFAYAVAHGFVAADWKKEAE